MTLTINYFEEGKGTGGEGLASCYMYVASGMNAQWREGAGREVWKGMCLGERGGEKLLRGMRGCMAILSNESHRLEQLTSTNSWAEGLAGRTGRMHTLRAWVKDCDRQVDERSSHAR